MRRPPPRNRRRGRQQNRQAGMADPRFYENRGPFTLAAICAKAGIAGPANAGALIFDVASLDGAGPQHLSFYAGSAKATDGFARSAAGFFLVPRDHPAPPPGMMVLPCESVNHAFAAAASLFYPSA